MVNYSLPLAITVLSLVAPPASAQFADGELGLTIFNASGVSPIEHRSNIGAWVQTILGSPSPMKGAAFTGDGLFVAASWQSPPAIHLYDSGGSQVFTFPMPELLGLPGDVSIFLNGQLAVCDQFNGKIELYTQAGVHQGTIGGMTNPSGTFVDETNHLWVSDIIGFTSPTGVIYEFDQTGLQIQSFPTTFAPGDLHVADDGTIWITNRAGGTNGEIRHLSNNGAPLGAFPTVNGGGWAIAVRDDGTIYTCGESASVLDQFSPAGVLLNSFLIPSAGSNKFAQFLAIKTDTAAGTSYCSGDGSGTVCPCGNIGAAGEGCTHSGGIGASLSVSGSADVAFDNIAFQVSNGPGPVPAIVFVGTQSASGGAGAIFGDGLLCAGGSIQRLGVVFLDMSGAGTWGPGLAPQGGWSAGDTRYFQGWFRDVTGPCSGQFNTTQGIEVNFF